MKKIILLLFLTSIKSFNSYAQIFTNDQTYVINTEHLKFPINNRGSIGNIDVDEIISFDGKSLIFTAGFILSGYSNGTLWVNGQFPSSRIQDYFPGPVNSDPNNLKHVFYVVNKNDAQFGESWQKWRDAVELGADFYDGDKDSIYNPVDKNNNGKWDVDEDMPDLMGEETIWCIYNDAMPRTDRRLFVDPQGIEIHQTVFINSKAPDLNDVIFFRYRVINRGTIADLMDSVYFGVWADPDIGYYADDLIGCDTLLNSGFCYNSGYDHLYGLDAPALYVSIIQGPAAYIPGKTFLDLNNNGIYNVDTDIPILFAFNIKDKLGVDTVRGASNLNISSFIPFFPGPFPEPNIYLFYYRLLMLGMPWERIVNPCSFPYGQVIGGVDCEKVNPYFIFSGDPVGLIGWINTFNYDQRFLLNTGPFILLKNKPVDIIVAYIATRGKKSLVSVRDTKIKTGKVMLRFNNNILSEFPKDESEAPPTNEVIIGYALEQNYPNPFNSNTKIKFSIRSASLLDVYNNNYIHVTLKVYDILGNEVAVLFDKRIYGGEYEVEFDPAKLLNSSVKGHGDASAVYFYQLNTGNFVQTKKMIYLR